MNILIVDDYPVNLKLLRAQLEGEGHTVLEAADGVEGLAVLEREAVDAIISDILMPRMDGYRFCHEVRANPRFHALPFIVYTATYTSPGDQKLALDVGADKYLTKPVSAADLVAALNAIVNQPRSAPRPAAPRELDVLKEYSERLVAKLEHKNIELLATHAKLEHLLAHSPAVIYSLKVAGSELIPQLISENITRLLGFTVAEACSYEWWASRLHPEDRGRALASIAETLQGEGLTCEYRLRHKAGRFVWVEDNRRTIRDAAGTPIEIAGVWTDITGRKAGEEAVRKFDAIVESADDAIIGTTLEGIITSWNPAARAMFGHSAGEIIGRPVVALIPPDRAGEENGLVGRIRNGERIRNFETVRLCKDGRQIAVSATISPVQDREGKLVGVSKIVRDITQQRSLERQLRQAQKMEAIGTLAGGIAHDFNNILGAINGFAELAKQDAVGNPAVLECLDEVARAGSRATDLVRQILTFSRQSEQQRTHLQLRHIVGEALKLLRATIPSSVQFSINLAADAPVVLADPTQIHQIAMNLGTNAAHAMRGRSGRLEVKLGKIVVDTDMAAANPSLQVGPYALLTISDTGHGMPREVLERIFEPFFTTKAPGEGTGLGLSVVHGIMKAHEGCITVYSQPGQGTTFHLYFPAVAADEVAAIPCEVTVPTGNGERVLFVDDEEALAKLGERMLVRLGYQVDAQTNPGAALEAFRREPQKYALVITDLTMPGMTGIQLAPELLRIRTDLPVILTTGYAANLTLDDVHALGIRELVLKPLSRQSLGEAVHRALRPALSKPGPP
jgi:PAS domain S-box-containing protein